MVSESASKSDMLSQETEEVKEREREVKGRERERERERGRGEGVLGERGWGVVKRYCLLVCLCLREQLKATIAVGLRKKRGGKQR